MQQSTDVGWAWVVLVASMGCNFLNGVLCYFVGVVHMGLLQKFQASVTTTAWVGSLYAANMSLTAPLAAMVIGRFGCRVCCVAGGLVCFGGFLASAFVPSIAWLFVTYGMISGLGLGLTYTPSIITIGFYFDKYRGMATGLSVSFAAIGILSGSLIAQTLIDQYSVSGAFLIIAATSLHFCFFGAFLRPTQYELSGSGHFSVDGEGGGGEEEEERRQLAAIFDSKASRLSLALHGIEIRAVSQCSSIHQAHEASVGRPGFGSVTSLLWRAQANRRRQNLESASLTASVLSGEAFPAKYGLDGAGSSCSIRMPAGDIVQVEYEEVVSPAKLEKLHFRSGPESPSKFPPDTLHADHNHHNAHRREPNGDCSGEMGTSVNHVLLDATTTNISLHEEEEDGGPANHHRLFPNGVHCLSSETDVRSFASSREDVKQQPEPWRKPRPVKESRALKRTRLLNAADSYVAILTHSAFMCHCASSVAANVHISGVYLHLPEYVHSKGTSSTDAAALFIAVGISSLLSRLATGFSTMDPRIEYLTLNIGMMGLCGLGTIFFPFYSDTYTGQLAFSAVFGLYTGGQYALVSVMCVHFMGLALLPTALGILAFFMGVGYVIGPPLAALIVDSGGTYQHSFIFLGAVMTLGSCLDMAAVYFSEPTTQWGEEEEEGGNLGGEGGEKEGVEETGELGVAAMSREWLGSTIVIAYQDAGSVHVPHNAGSVLSVRSRTVARNQDVNT